MRKFILSEETLMLIIASAADASLMEGRSFTDEELTLTLEYISKMPKVVVINNKEESYGNQLS